MNVPSNDSLFWPCLLTVALVAGYCVVATIGTKNGFDVAADSKAILTMIGTVIAYAFTKRMSVGPQEPKQ